LQHETDKQQEKASRQAHTQETAKKKINEEKQNRKHKWKRAKCNHVQEKAKNQRSRFLQEYGSKTSYTLEDGHVGRNM
jgi:hypothetical protein